MIPDEDEAPDAEFELDRVGRSRKAPTAFRTISEVADDLHVPQHVLRFWETRFEQVKPLKRGGGRRYYRPEDVVLLRRISDLLYIQGYTIKGVQRLLREGDGTLEGDLPPPDAADRDEGPPAQAALHKSTAVQAIPARTAEPGDITTPRQDVADEVRRLRRILSDVLAELEGMRRRITV